MKVKICGITLEEEVLFLNKLKVDYIGFVFCDSKRRVSIERGKNLVERVKKIETVGVFKDNSIEFVKDVYKKTGIKIIQLHGDENQEYIEKLIIETNINKKNIIKALKINHIENIKLYKDINILIDGQDPGSGKSFNYELVSKISREFILAGGISLKNIKDIPKNKNIIGVDLSTGVEEIVKGRRVKSEIKVVEFLKEIKGGESYGR